MKRRELFSLAPAAAAACVVPAQAGAVTPEERSALLAVIERLEAGQGWEASCVAAAKAFAAWHMRRALGLDMPDPRLAQMHIDYQQGSFKDYQRSMLYERRIANGETPEIPLWERGLA